MTKNPFPDRKRPNSSLGVEEVVQLQIEQRQAVVKIATMVANAVREHSPVAGMLDEYMVKDARKLLSGDWLAPALCAHTRRADLGPLSLIVLFAEVLNSVGRGGLLPRAGSQEDAKRMAHRAICDALKECTMVSRHGIKLH